MMIQKLIDTSGISSDACYPPSFNNSYDYKQITSKLLKEHGEKPYGSWSILIGANPEMFAKLQSVTRNSTKRIMNTLL